MSENIVIQDNRKKLIERLETMLSTSEPDYEKVNNTRLWELEEKIGVSHFEFVESSDTRGGYIPLKNISKKEIELLSK